MWNLKVGMKVKFAIPYTSSTAITIWSIEENDIQSVVIQFLERWSNFIVDFAGIQSEEREGRQEGGSSA